MEKRKHGNLVLRERGLWDLEGQTCFGFSPDPFWPTAGLQAWRWAALEDPGAGPHEIHQMMEGNHEGT